MKAMCQVMNILSFYLPRNPSWPQEDSNKKNHCWYLSHQCVKKKLRGWIFNLENRSSNSKGQDQIWWTHEERHGIIGVVDVEGKTRFFFQ